MIDTCGEKVRNASAGGGTADELKEGDMPQEGEHNHQINRANFSKATESFELLSDFDPDDQFLGSSRASELIDSISNLSKAKTMKNRGFDQTEQGKRLIAAKTDSLNQSMKNMIEMQKSIDNTHQ